MSFRRPLSVSLPPAAVRSGESRLFLHFDRLLRHIIGGFLRAPALKGCPLLSALMRKWAALHWYVPALQWKFNVLSVNNTQHQSRICALIKERFLCLCSLQNKMHFRNWLSKYFYVFLIKVIVQTHIFQQWQTIAFFKAIPRLSVFTVPAKWTSSPAVYQSLPSPKILQCFDYKRNKMFPSLAISNSQYIIIWIVTNLSKPSSSPSLFHPRQLIFFFPWQGSWLHCIISTSPLPAWKNLFWQLQAAEAAKRGFCRLLPSLY